MKERLHVVELMDMFDEMLDDVFGPVNVCGYEFTPDHALRQLNPEAYRREFHVWLDDYMWAEDSEDPDYYVRGEDKE